jgi:hypothetical protein
MKEQFKIDQHNGTERSALYINGHSINRWNNSR